MEWRCIAVDFDHTLARLNDAEYRGLFAIFTACGVPLEMVASSYQEVKASSGFSIQNLFDVVAGKVSFALDREAIRGAFAHYLREKLLPYSDSLPAVRAWRAQGIPVVIVTVGEASYQREKVAAVEIPYDDLLTTPRANEKAQLISELLARYGEPLAFLDDKATELDALRDRYPNEDELVTVRVRRPDSPYYHQRARHRHLDVDTLAADVLVQRFDVTVLGR